MGREQRSVRAMGPTALGIMMAEEWTVEVKTTEPRLALLTCLLRGRLRDSWGAGEKTGEQ